MYFDNFFSATKCNFHKNRLFCIQKRLFFQILSLMTIKTYSKLISFLEFKKKLCSHTLHVYRTTVQTEFTNKI